MAVRTREEILTLVKERIGEGQTDDDISFIEDVTDTLSDMEKRIAEAGDWKTKYEENDASWRKKYKERFFDSSNDLDEALPEGDVTQTEIKTYDDLFKEG